MTRFLSLLVLALVCAGCSSGPASAPVKVQARAPISQAQAEEAARKEVAAVAPASTKSGQTPESIQHKAITHLAGQPADAAQQEEDQLQTEVESWFTGLSQGNIQYRIPSPMFWKEGSTVTVVVLGPKALPSAGLAQPNGGGALKVSNQMKVLLSSPGDPNEFTIAAANGSTDVQFVPENGATTWSWTVTPKYTGANQSLQVSAWVLYPNNDSILLELPAYTATVNVNVPGFGTAIKQLLEGDPEYWLKYGLPGGGGFIFVSGIVTWIVKRRKKKAKTA